MLYEYRMYEAVPGRLPDLLSRFEKITLGVWSRHGIEQVGFWLADVGTSNQLHYLLRWRDLADREVRWTAFQADPDWIDRRAATETDGPIVARVQNQFWKPTAFSAMM
jgi:NIPSNAP